MKLLVSTHTKKLLEALSTADESASDPVIDEELRNDVIKSANRSRKTQKSLRKTIELLAIKSLFNDDLTMQPRPHYTGTIMGFKKDQLFVSLDDFATDIKVYDLISSRIIKQPIRLATSERYLTIINARYGS